MSDYNVIDYGAKGDGATDDTEAIQRACDATPAGMASVVRFPAGHYLTSRTIVVDGARALTWEGDGYSNTLLEYRPRRGRGRRVLDWMICRIGVARVTLRWLS